MEGSDFQLYLKLQIAVLLAFMFGIPLVFFIWGV